MGGARVYIGGLPPEVRERDLEGFFRGYGRLQDISIKNGYGFVEFDSYRDADVAAYALNGKDLLGKRVIVQRARGAPKRVRSLRSGTTRGGGGDGAVGKPDLKCGGGEVAKDSQNNENSGSGRHHSPGSRKFVKDLIQDCETAEDGNISGGIKRRGSRGGRGGGDGDNLSVDKDKECGYTNPRKQDVGGASLRMIGSADGDLKMEAYLLDEMLDRGETSVEHQRSEVLEGTVISLSKCESIPDSATEETQNPPAECFEQLRLPSLTLDRVEEICEPASIEKQCSLELIAGVDEIGSCELLSEPHGIPTLELLSRSNNHVNRGDQILSFVHLAVHEQLRNWGIGFEAPTTRGRSKARKSNSNKSRSDDGANRLVEAKLKNWDVTVKVPILIKETCDFLREHITTEGIFRKSGSACRVQNLMQRFIDLKKDEEFCFSQCDTVFDVAAVLKQYLREMDIPLIPYSIHDLFRRCLEVPSESSSEDAVLLCTCLLSEFSISILTYLIEFLTEVVQNSDSNKMSYENLAIVFGPNIMPVERKKNDKVKELEHERKFVQTHIKIVETLIRNGHKLGCLSPELQKKIESDFSLHGSEDELENDGINRRGRSGSLTRVLGFLRKVARNRAGGDTPVAQTPDFASFTHTPIMKSSKRRCLDGNMFSLQKKKTLLDSIRKNGLVVKDDDKRFAHISGTPRSVAGFVTCPPPVMINPSLTKMDCKQAKTPDITAHLKTVMVTTSSLSLLRSADQSVDLTIHSSRVSPKRCTLKRGRPNTLRSGLARPGAVQISPRKSQIPRYIKITQK